MRKVVLCLRLRLLVVFAALSLIPDRNKAAQSFEARDGLSIDRVHPLLESAIRVWPKDDESRIGLTPALRIRGGQANTVGNDFGTMERWDTNHFNVVVEGDAFCSAGRLVMLSPAQVSEPWAAAHAGLLGRIGDPPFPADTPASMSGQPPFPADASDSRYGQLLVMFEDPLDPHAGIGSDQEAEGWFDVSVNGSQALVYFEHSPAAFIALAEAAQASRNPSLPLFAITLGVLLLLCLPHRPIFSFAFHILSQPPSFSFSLQIPSASMVYARV